MEKLNLSSNVKSIPGVGSVFATKLAELEITTVGELLWHIPFRYESFEKATCAGAEIGQNICLTATVLKADNIFTPRGKKLTTAKVADETGSLNLIWFNQHYLKSQLKQNTPYNFYGRVTSFNNRKYLTSPSIEPADEPFKSPHKMVPVYHLTQGLSSSWINKTILKALSLLTPLPEIMPEKTLERTKIAGFETALKFLHLPQSTQEPDLGKQRLGFEELFTELLVVELRKHLLKTQNKGVRFTIPENYLTEFERKLPFKLTTSQKKSLEQIAQDLKGAHPMNRLLEGDVGTGKTAVAAGAAYLCLENQMKVVYMAPTEILAKQQYESLKKMLGQEVSLITSANSKDSDTHSNILVGTHALLYSKELAKNSHQIGLVVIDEQHRFGVVQRSSLLNPNHDGALPNILTMSATPIPRTLALTIYGDLEISRLTEFPSNKRSVTSKVLTNAHRSKMYEYVKKANQPTFIVCPFIEQSENPEFENVKAAEHEFLELQKVLPKSKMALIHGKMKSKDQLGVIEKFRAGEIQFLVSTPVVEVGVDIPTASVMVIESAERYGLASLHQLRGRVGRSGTAGICFFVYSGKGGKSYQRLKYLESIDNGHELAELDLKLRGEGEITGTRQSGMRRFKVADTYNLEAIEKAKLEADFAIKNKLLEKSPLLQKHVSDRIKGIMA